MKPSLSVIIPALDEEARIATAIDAAFAAGAAEVLVADGGSSDRTIEVAQQRGARIIAGEPMRARQLNRGAEAASGDMLVFVHADTLLPTGAAAAIDVALEDYVFGGFRIAFLETSRRLTFVAAMINARTRLTREPWGDQAQFIRRDTFLASGGLREIPIMEDYELAARMKRTGRTTVLSLPVRTSGRRFLRKGIVLTAMVNWLIIAGYHTGVSPDRLARWYR